MNNFNLQKACSCFFIVIFPFLSNAQKHNYLNEVVMNPPNAASLGMFFSAPITISHPSTKAILFRLIYKGMGLMIPPL